MSPDTMDQDLEPGLTFAPITRRSTWLPSRPRRQMSGISMVSTVNPNALSPGNPILCKSLVDLTVQILTLSASLAPLSPEEETARDKLIAYLVADDIWKGTVSNACSWYSRYLQSRFIEHWHLLAPALVGLDDNSKTPQQNDLVFVFEFVHNVAKVLKTQKACALTDIVDELGNDGLLKDQLDEERAKPNQIVFAAVGWLSMQWFFV